MDREMLVRALASVRTDINKIALVLTGAVQVIRESANMDDEHEWIVTTDVKYAVEELLSAASYIDSALEALNESDNRRNKPGA